MFPLLVLLGLAAAVSKGATLTARSPERGRDPMAPGVKSVHVAPGAKRLAPPSCIDADNVVTMVTAGGEWRFDAQVIGQRNRMGRVEVHALLPAQLDLPEPMEVWVFRCGGPVGLSA